MARPRGYPFEHRWLALGGGAKMHYLDEGEGETLLFVHGTPTWSFEWRHLVRAFAPPTDASLRIFSDSVLRRPRDFAYTRRRTPARSPSSRSGSICGT